MKWKSLEASTEDKPMICYCVVIAGGGVQWSLVTGCEFSSLDALKPYAKLSQTRKMK